MGLNLHEKAFNKEKTNKNSYKLTKEHTRWPSHLKGKKEHRSSSIRLTLAVVLFARDDSLNIWKIITWVLCHLRPQSGIQIYHLSIQMYVVRAYFWTLFWQIILTVVCVYWVFLGFYYTRLLKLLVEFFKHFFLINNANRFLSFHKKSLEFGVLFGIEFFSKCQEKTCWSVDTRHTFIQCNFFATQQIFRHT